MQLSQAIKQRCWARCWQGKLVECYTKRWDLQAGEFVFITAILFGWWQDSLVGILLTRCRCRTSQCRDTKQLFFKYIISTNLFSDFRCWSFKIPRSLSVFKTKVWCSEIMAFIIQWKNKTKSTVFIFCQRAVCGEICSIGDLFNYIYLIFNTLLWIRSCLVLTVWSSKHTPPSLCHAGLFMISTS